MSQLYFYTHIDCPLGKIILISDGQALTGLYFQDQKSKALDYKLHQDPSLKIFAIIQTQLAEYFTGKRKSFDLNYQFTSGTDFQKKVWNAVAQIPHGSTLSYKALAKSLGLPKSIRAVATAVGQNPIMLIVPCHRIIGSNGSLTGYAGGLKRKSDLLNMEAKMQRSS